MKMVAERDELAQVLSAVSKGVKERAVEQILETLHLKVLDGELQVTGTDLKITIRANVPVETDEPAELCVSGRLFSEFVDNLPSGPVEMVLTKNRFKCQGGTFKSSFAIVRPDDYPQALSDFGDVKWLEVGAEGLARAISRTVFCTLVDSSRPFIQAVQVKKEGKKLVFRATDGVRMSRFELPLLSGRSWPEALIPGYNLRVILKAVLQEEDPIRLAVSKNAALFLVGKYIFSSQLIEANFPDTDQILETKMVAKLLCPAGLLSRSLRVMTLFAVSSPSLLAQSVLLHYEAPKGDLENSRLHVEIDVPEVGKSENTMDCAIEGGIGDPVRVRTDHFIEAVASIGGSQAVLELGKAVDPIFLRSPDSDDYVHVLMPVIRKSQEKG